MKLFKSFYKNNNDKVIKIFNSSKFKYKLDLVKINLFFFKK